MPGIKEGRGDWEYRTLILTAASVISAGSAVAYAAARTVSNYSGGQGGLLGFLKGSSANSIPAGRGIVAIPAPNCTAFVDVPTGLAASALSMGESYGLYAQSGMPVSSITNAAYSAASRVVTIVGVIDSTNSTIEVSFLANSGQLYSTSTVSIQ